MINSIPENWQYDASLEALFFFYQATNELLSDTTPDSYALPLHNPITLVYEMDEIYSWLESFNIIDEYYKRYIPNIIDEFLFQVTNDKILKKIIGSRLESITTGFTEAKEDYKFFKKWIGLFKQICPPTMYMKNYKNQIESLVKNNSKDKTILLYCIKNYYIILLFFGYSREFIYKKANAFFNKNIQINSVEQISSFLDIFDKKEKIFEFLVLMNTATIEYLNSIHKDIKLNIEIEKIQQEERDILCKEQCVKELFNEYDLKHNHTKDYETVEVVRYRQDAVDPYCAADKLVRISHMLQMFRLYFIHFSSSKQVYKLLLKTSNGKYIKFYLPRRLQKRPYVRQEVITSRITNILSQRAMSLDVFYSLMQAIEMHAEAISTKNHSTLIRNLCTALESLFLDPDINSGRDNVIKSIVAIIQKTYILKTTRLIYNQLVSAIHKDRLTTIGVDSYKNFIKLISSYDNDSPEMKKIYAELPENPLLRFKLFTLRKTFKNGESILDLMESHQQKIVWQLNRIYRIRNIVTHLGQEPYGLATSVNHLHNYFDYIINYMLCKSENNDLIISMSTLVFEAKNDNLIHHELLKSKILLSKENYMQYFFGADSRLVNYDFS